MFLYHVVLYDYYFYFFIFFGGGGIVRWPRVPRVLLKKLFIYETPSSSYQVKKLHTDLFSREKVGIPCSIICGAILRRYFQESVSKLIRCSILKNSGRLLNFLRIQSGHGQRPW